MLGWLKNIIPAGAPANATAGSELRALFEPIEKSLGAKARIAERLTRFVLSGEGEAVLTELAALQGVTHGLTMNTIYYTGQQVTRAPSLASLVKLLPEDAELYLRLALVYEAMDHSGSGGVRSLYLIPIPAFAVSAPWLTLFLVKLSDSGTQREAFFPARLVQGMIAAKGEDPNVLLRGPFFYEDSQGKSQLSRWVNKPFAYFQCLRGFVELVLSAPEIIQPAFRQKDAGSRACLLRALAALDIPPHTFAEEIAALAVSGSKEVRESADYLISGRFAVFQAPLQRYAEKGSSDERYHAVRLLSRIGGDGVRVFLRQRLEVEKSDKISSALRDALADPQTDSVAEAPNAGEDYQLTAISEVPVRAPLDKQVLLDLRICLDEFERRAADEFARNKFAQARGVPGRTPIKPDTADKLFAALQTFVVKDGTAWLPFETFALYCGSAYQSVQRFPAHPNFDLVHLVRWCLILSGRPANLTGWAKQHWILGFAWQVPFLTFQKARKKPIDLRELAAVFRTVGLDERTIGVHLLQANRYFSSPLLRSDPDLIWPYFAERLDLLEEALGLKQVQKEGPAIHFWEQDKRQNAFGILKLFPRLPARFVPLLWDLALASAKIERRWAQECLDKLPNKETRIVAALTGRQQDARVAAAQWLAELNHKEAIPALRLALSKEKSEGVKDELIKALEALGVPLEDLLNLDKLDHEAEKGLSKGLPKDLDWFPFTQLPMVRWEGSDKPVPAAIIQWFLVQGHKLNSAEANPTLRRYCSLFRQDDREKLGRFVLDAWIAQDTKPKYTAAQAAALAEQEAKQMAAFAVRSPQYFPDFDEQRVYQSSFNRHLVQPEGSQTSTRGILAVAGACCGAEAAAIVHRYIKQWYGYRAAQSKALLQVLAWIGHPSATQVILSVANRFRTKGIQEEAVRLCQLLAVRKGWTLDELADRTIPTTGFDEEGTMELDYGARTFTAGLSEEMTIVLSNQAGKTIASLPDANQSDEAEKVKQAKAALSTSKKELKSVLAMQRDRLYEALCTQRTWRFEDWDTHLRRHPIVGRYCQRLVWVAYNDDAIIEQFRPLPDGSLTNFQDDEVRLDQEAVIRLGHDETLAAADRTTWLQHFSDYKVEPLFQQFGKAAFTLTEEMKQASEIGDFLGHIVKAFSLRTRLTRLGYTRGAAQDGGWFYEYHKSFLGLGIEAIIEFTGNGLPEANRTVALRRLYFARKIQQGGPAVLEELALGELPRVLLAECWNDMRMAAADGSGFAADWEKQTEM